MRIKYLNAFGYWFKFKLKIEKKIANLIVEIIAYEKGGEQTYLKIWSRSFMELLHQI